MAKSEAKVSVVRRPILRVFITRTEPDDRGRRRQFWTAEIADAGKAFVSVASKRRSAIRGLRRVLSAAPGHTPRSING